MQEKIEYDLIVIGSGAAGLIASIKAKESGINTLLIEKLPTLGSKLKATGGGKCNLTNTLDNETFISSFGKSGRFMTKALEQFDHKDLIEFFKTIDIDTHSPDGFRVFPITHSSNTIINGLENRLKDLKIDILTNTTLVDISTKDNSVDSIITTNGEFKTKNIILATGGIGFSKLGTTGDGQKIVQKLGHKITHMYPAMIPLHTKELWVANCTADTIPKATIKINIKKHSKLKKTGDLIFTKKGLRGPVILDFAREITPLLEKYGEVPILVNLTKGLNEDDIIKFIKESHQKNPQDSILNHLEKILPNSLSKELLNICNISQNITYNKIEGNKKQELFKILAWTPLNIIGHDGLDKAMITRGGIELREIDQNTLKSKLISGLYFAGEIVDIDGPCGGYNLQWAFSSGTLASRLL
jgi:predicted Rossmann fold flavoprotein